MNPIVKASRTRADTEPVFLPPRLFRLDPFGTSASILLLAGVALRVAYAFPVHKYAADADALQTGLRAFRILEGQHPVFYTSVRLGAFECYLHALAFSIFGISRASLSLATLVSGSAVLVSYLLFTRSLLGPRAACFALLFVAIPPPAYMFWTYMPIGYAETMLFCATTLWLAEVLRRKGGGRDVLFAFGVSIGLGFWNSLQSLGCTIPALAWLALTRSYVLRRLRFYGWTGGGFLVGGFPWIVYNVRHPFASFREDFMTHPAFGVEQAISNFQHLFRYSLPELTASLGGVNASRLLQSLRVPVLGVYAAAVLFAIALLARWVRRKTLGERAAAVPDVALLLVVAGTVCGLAVFSRAGELRGPTVRYILLLHLVLAAMAGLLLARVWRSSRIVAGALVLLVLAFNFAVYSLPGTPERLRWQANGKRDSVLIAALRQNGVELVYGNYWVVYPLNFLTREAIRGIPAQAQDDHYGYAARLDWNARRWAVVSGDRLELEAWAAELGWSGRILEAGSFVFLPSRNPPGFPLPVLERFRAVRTKID
jgi:Dolichyl-phosphate-mannose-protein mannosyltransferase